MLYILNVFTESSKLFQNLSLHFSALHAMFYVTIVVGVGVQMQLITTAVKLYVKHKSYCMKQTHDRSQNYAVCCSVAANQAAASSCIHSMNIR